MQVFFCDHIIDKVATLSVDEVHHLRVLHYKPGDEIILMDGQGNKITGIITSLKKKSATVNIHSIEVQPENPRPFNICIAPTKNINRIEWVVEKMIEFGVHGIYFFSSAQSERYDLNLNRVQKKVISASKQSYKWHHPVLHEITGFKDLVKNPTFAQSCKMIAHLSENSENAISVIRKHRDTPLVFMVGPEGDFNEEELVLASANGWTQVYLGRERLRTETAALYATTLNYTVDNL